MLVDTYKRFFLTIDHVYFAEKLINTKSDISRYYQLAESSQTGSSFTTPIINLREDITAIRAHFRKSVNSEIDEAEFKYNITTSYHAAPDEHLIKDFCEFYDRFAIAKGIPNSDRHKLFRLKDNVIITKAFYKGMLMVVHLYIFDEKRLRLLYSATAQSQCDNERKIIVRANKLLHLSDMVAAKANKFILYDFGGIALENKELSGINLFKMGFTKNIETSRNALIGNSTLGKIIILLRTHILGR